MTAVDVAALEAARAAATPGEWVNDVGRMIHNNPVGRVKGGYVASVEHAADAAYIVAIHNALPDLLAAVRERDTLRAGVEALLRDWQVGIEVLDTVDRFEAVDRLRALLADMGGGGQ